MEIRVMTLDDLNELSPILTNDFDDFWNINLLKSEFDSPNSQCIVATLNNKIVGFGCIWQAVDVMHITNIVVKKDQRNHGIGSLLLKELINISTNDKNITSITLEVKETNIPAQNLYKKYGFEIVGIRKKYYDAKFDALIMTLEVNK